METVCKRRTTGFAETPATAAERIRFQDGAIRERKPKDIKITWEKLNLTTNFDAQIKISLYGYREVTIAPELVYIDVLAVSRPIRPAALCPAGRRPRLTAPSFFVRRKTSRIPANTSSSRSRSKTATTRRTWT